MASATIETFCCIASEVEPGILQKLQFNFVPYNIVCIISSIFGTLGAFYQITPSSSPAQLSFQTAGYRQRRIINWLAGADFCASAGILCRAIFWLIDGDVVRNYSEQSDKNMILCAMFSMWIRFFYTATYFWTMCYAFDVYCVARQKNMSMNTYHIFTWSTSLCLSMVGLGTLYLPKFQCHSGAWRVLPNYLLSYIPILFVMVINPILYFLSSKHLRMLLSGCLGQLTCIEHSILGSLREKFFSIVLVFYVCWIPNIINGIVLWGFWPNIPQGFTIGIWYAMAFVNPLQAVLNSLVYKGWGECHSLRCFFPFFKRAEAKQSSLMHNIEHTSSDYHINSADDPISTHADIQYING